MNNSIDYGCGDGYGDGYNYASGDGYGDSSGYGYGHGSGNGYGSGGENIYGHGDINVYGVGDIYSTGVGNCTCDYVIGSDIVEGLLLIGLAKFQNERENSKNENKSE